MRPCYDEWLPYLLLFPDVRMIPRRILLLLCVLACDPSLIGSTIRAQDAEARSRADAAFVQKFVATHCAGCHGKDQLEADVSVARLTREGVTEDTSELFGRVLEQLEFRSMPPAEEDQPKQENVDQVKQWIRQQLAAAGIQAEIDHKLKQPSYANLLPHDPLFDGSVTGPAASPPRLWRIHPDAYVNFLAGFGNQLSKGGPLSKPFTVGEGKGEVTNYADLMQADSATLSQLMLNCRQIAQLQTVGFTRLEKDRKSGRMVEKIYRNAPNSFAEIMDFQGEHTDEQLLAAVTEEFGIVLNRKPNGDEAIAYQRLLRKAIGEGGAARGLRTMATAVLLRPEAIFRMEVGLGKTDKHGRRMLSPYELAHALAFALTDRAPDKVLLGPVSRNKRPTGPSLMDLARDGKLSTREDVRRVVTQMWETEHVEKPRILRFFREFFGYGDAEKVFKGDRGSRALHFSTLLQDADHLILHFVKEDKNVLAELLTTDRFFVVWRGRDGYDRTIDYVINRKKLREKPKDRNYRYFITRTEEKGLRAMPQANPEWRRVVRFYNFDEELWDYPLDQPFPMPTGQRVGILTHPAWLIAWSGNFDNDPIRRGKWIREHLLAGTIPDVPITVNAAVPEDPHKTLRQRLEVTREDYCWKCHQKMNPLGMPFEVYNDFGQFRDKEGLGHTKALQKPKETAPVVTTGEIINSGDPGIDGPVENLAELMEKLAGSDRVRQSFVRHTFRYWMGRNEKLADSPTLMAADRAYTENGGSFKSLVISLLTSDSFLYRK